jgi:phage repressor protein C with HTH and peptisase S24 domain
MKNTDLMNDKNPAAASPWKIVEKLREIKGISKKTLADKLQINYSYLVDLLNGRYLSKIDNEKINTLSEILEIPVDDLLKALSGGEKTDKPTQTKPPTSESECPKKEAADTQLPLITHSSESVIPDITGFIKMVKGKSETYSGHLGRLNGGLSANYNATAYLKNNVFALKLEDDSLFPPFAPGTIFLVNKNKFPSLNEIVFVVLRDGRSWLREWSKEDDEGIILKPYNPKYEYLQILTKDIIAMWTISGIELP